ncbi:thiol:disulfide interchange protein DsbA [Fontimonas thermophila]|uniref:Thiol:disulfide interchange protein n=1 Tax=Fontimonas thermophila TaxID=1076937 RepID=A0A1I2H4I2_9GAMM|nr:thiol:disulfide interchange protein DsbA/DsbL [Fontimonas thermophila]SFF24592.1 thiol:disulfide interchange protein DsbA [Fontimonas thermophila]
MRCVLRGLFATAFSLLAFACSAGDSQGTFTEGKDYKRVREVQAPADPKRIEVNEFFWYGCPHCYAFDPAIEAWAKTRPGDVDFVRVPTTLGRPEGRLHAKAFYTAEILNALDAMHPALFDTLHKQHQPLNGEAQIQALFNRTTGVLPDVFSATFNGFAVDARVRKAEQLAMSYGITSVPTLVVGGTYVTSPAMAHGFTEATRVLDFLIDKVRKERAGR